MARGRARRSSGGFWSWRGSARAEETGWAGNPPETEWDRSCGRSQKELDSLTDM